MGMHPLKAARKACGITQRQLAIQLGLPGDGDKSAMSQIIRWEKGEKTPNAERAAKLAHILGFESGEEVQRLCREWRDAPAAIDASRH